MIVGCLALNASFEPLTMVPMRRALRLVIDGKAEIVEADPERVVRSERLTLAAPGGHPAHEVHPRAATLPPPGDEHVPVRARPLPLPVLRPHAVELKPRESLTRDHLIPLSRGGTNDWTNVVTACSPATRARRTACRARSGCIRCTRRSSRTSCT